MIRRAAWLASALLLVWGTPLTFAREEPEPIRAFRSVLDGRARIVTVRLPGNMFAAYDATNCALYKVWVGDVKLDGAVYTTVHGPQPTSQGGPAILDEREHVWRWIGDEKNHPVKTRFRGYHRHGLNGVALRFELSFLEHTVLVEEFAWYVPAPEGEGGIRREITLKGVPPGGQLELSSRIRGCEQEDLILTNATQLTQVTGKRTIGSKQLLDIEVRWLFDKSGKYTIAPLFNLALLAEEEELRLKKLAEEEARKKAGQDAEKPAVKAHPTDTPLGHGVSVRVYQIGAGMSKLHKLVAGQTPNWSHVIPVLDLRTERGDFGKATDEFITHVDGFLEVPADGEYAFQLISDDGSKLFIDDKEVIDHDGLHGPTGKEGTVTLTKGRHKLFVEHFEQGGGEQLTLNWRPPGATGFVLVPNAVLLAPTGEVRVTSPGNKKIEKAAVRGRPGDGRPLDAVHPAFDLMQARPDGFEPRVGGMDWLPDGRLVLCNWEPRGGVYVLDGVHGDDPSKITVKRIAEGLAEPLGLRVVDGRLFVLQKQELTELIDHDGDEIVDEYRCVANGWGVTANFHEFAFGLVYKDEHLYAALATAINPGGASTQPQNEDRGKVVKIAMDGSYEFIAEGLRTPNGIGIGVNGEIFVTDNQGDWVPVSKVVRVRPGAFYGSHSVDPEGTKDRKEQPPVVWLPQGEIGNSPGEPGILLEGPYKGQMAHCDVTHGGLKRVYVEKVRGQYQGCVFRFTQGLEAGINRWTRSPNGDLFVGGIGSSGNWGQTGKKKFGLQRLRYNGNEVFDIESISVTKDGIQLRFTQPMDARGLLMDTVVQQWRYEPTKDYGGPKLDVETLQLKHVIGRFGEARDQFMLVVPGLKEGRVVYFRLPRTVRNEAGEALWSTEAWYTLNRLPRGYAPKTYDDLPTLVVPHPGPNALGAAEKREGWQLLFDGESCVHWRGFKKEKLPSAWSAKNGTLTFDPKGGERGDIITKQQFENYVFAFEWKVGERGNSGVMYHVTEDHGAPWATGPEYQILDNEGHGDGISKKTSAGANYALHAPRPRRDAPRRKVEPRPNRRGRHAHRALAQRLEAARIRARLGGMEEARQEEQVRRDARLRRQPQGPHLPTGPRRPGQLPQHLHQAVALGGTPYTSITIPTPKEQAHRRVPVPLGSR